MFPWGKSVDELRGKNWVYLDVTVEDGLGESLQGRALGQSQAGLHVEERASRCVSGPGCGVGVTQDLEVVVDRVANHHLPDEQLQDLPKGKTFTH